ncbi:nitrogen fixation protein NifH [uncultured Sphaerochaeta sp.]|uniref:nitrogen fixation protein NifH n=1 Tax=uncultured Sphaerochaeta sp. TaxID=886478 RepID=UPI002A0A106F|nr:nitrogen fixation protein NifH [uncultured Sphaerochaeta sp.]
MERTGRYTASEQTISWLLSSESPSMRYFTLVDLLDASPEDDRVQKEKTLIMQQGYVPEILRAMSEPAYEAAFPKYYTYKYEGLVWSLIVLAEMGATRIPAIEMYCEYLFEHAQERTDGGFSMHSSKSGGGRASEVIPCLTGNMVWSLSRLGYRDDPRVLKALSFLVDIMVTNDGIEVERQRPPYNRYEECWGNHTCFMGVVKSLKAFSAFPKDRWTTAMYAKYDQMVEFLFIHHLFKRSHDLDRVAKPGWRSFGFPMMYQSDVLEILDILTSLGVQDQRMEEAMKLVVSKQDEHGRWNADNTYGSDRLLIPIGKKGVSSEWVTLRALRVLKRYNQV